MCISTLRARSTPSPHCIQCDPDWAASKQSRRYLPLLTISTSNGSACICAAARSNHQDGARSRVECLFNQLEVFAEPGRRPARWVPSVIDGRLMAGSGSAGCAATDRRRVPGAGHTPVPARVGRAQPTEPETRGEFQLVAVESVLDLDARRRRVSLGAAARPN